MIGLGSKRDEGSRDSAKRIKSVSKVEKEKV